MERDMDENNHEDLTNQINSISMDDFLDDDFSGTTNDMEVDYENQDPNEIPTSLIVTHLNADFFDNEGVKVAFETQFRQFEEFATFQYLKSFRRVRVNYSSSDVAAWARIQLHEATVCGQSIKCYFAQPAETGKEDASHHLQLPKPEKQFLISPPASPPVDWEPSHEGIPVVNYDLLSALSKLAPGQAHELHPPSANHPAIVVHICEDPTGFESNSKIEQTRCPERNTCT